MPSNTNWLAIVLRLTSVPLLLGALAVATRPEHPPANLAAAVALLLVGTIHLLYWWQAWPIDQRRAVAALGAMIPPLALLQQVLPVSEPLLWLYPATIAGAGLGAPVSAIVVGLMALAAVFPIIPVDHADAALVVVLGPAHAIFLSIVLAGLGMAAVRQLILVNADLRATKAELADLAVARERERLARDLHDLLGRTLSLIAVKAELANRLSAGRTPSAEDEMGEVQQLARSALRDVREALTAYRTPSVSAELAAARLALRSAGIEANVTSDTLAIDPANEATIAWALREAITNVVKHSGARHCWIALTNTASVATLDVADDGLGPGDGGGGSGLRGLAERIHALGGMLEVGPGAQGGFRVRVTLKAGTPDLETVR